ncbi:MAG TPA: c-type cytochrome [Actinomycetota bacterium]|nr:c-type cytochrome [Actinomycetota bacterium]
MRPSLARRWVAWAIVAAGLLGAVVAACTSVGSEPPPQVPGGNPKAGADAIVSHGCGACHTIPGIRGADGLVGPPLIHWSRRGFIAGELPNNGQNLIRWVEDPKGVEPGTDMPNTGLTPTEARDIAAYLFTIR